MVACENGYITNIQYFSRLKKLISLKTKDFMRYNV